MEGVGGDLQTTVELGNWTSLQELHLCTTTK